MDQMQRELQATYPLLRIELIGINEPNQEGGNTGATNGRDIPWLQDVDANSNGRGDASMDLWQMAFRDVVMLDGNNRKVGVYNLNQHDLAVRTNYDTLKQMFIDGAMVSQRPWRNPANPLDVSNNGIVVPLDVLRVVNVLNGIGPHKLPPPVASQSPPPFLDVNGDGNVTPADALAVINFLNSGLAQGEGESSSSLQITDGWSVASFPGGVLQPGGDVLLANSSDSDHTVSQAGDMPEGGQDAAWDDAARRMAADRLFAEYERADRKAVVEADLDEVWFDLFPWELANEQSFEE